MFQRRFPVKSALKPLVCLVAIGLLGATPAHAQRRGGGGVRVAGPRVGAAVRVGPRVGAAVVVRGGPVRPYRYYDPFYDPFWYGGYYRPFYWGPVVPYGSAYYGNAYYDDASLRIQVTPKQTEVYVDGYYAGTVDDFDGVFQRLHLESGSHDLTLYLDGFKAVHQRIYVQPTSTFRVRYTMQPLAAGEAAEPRPVQPAQPPAPQGRPGQPPRAGALPPRPNGPPQGPEPGGPPPFDRSNADGGAIALRVQPASAEVFIDGERWQTSDSDDRLVVDVEPGPHQIEVRRDGYRTYRTDIDVRPGETRTLNVSLSRQ